MNNRVSKEFATMHALLRSLRLVSALGTGVNPPVVVGAHSASVRLLKLFASLAALTTLAAVTAVAAQADTGALSWGPATPNFNLQVILRPVGGATDSAFGLVKFRQPKDAEKIVYLDVWVRDLAPNHSYSLQRAVDTNVNDDCTGTSWLTLGQGLVPYAITTDETGTGRADLFRNLASIPLGTQFDIHFRVIDAVTSAVVLESACYQYTVSQ
jgi:hypothetical protein